MGVTQSELRRGGHESEKIAGLKEEKGREGKGMLQIAV